MRASKTQLLTVTAITFADGLCWNDGQQQHMGQNMRQIWEENGRFMKFPRLTECYVVLKKIDDVPDKHLQNQFTQGPKKIIQ